MNITLEETGHLSATIRIELGTEDYKPKVDQKLREYQRKANIPGFRPGKVPFGMINKMYGRAVMAEEINTMLSSTLDGYIKEQNLITLGTPLANEEKTPKIDWEQTQNLEFFFDIGLAPTIDPELDQQIEVDYFDIAVEDDELEKEVEMIRRSYGKLEKAETAAEGDWLSVDIKELDEKGVVLEGGIQHTRRITSATFHDEASKKLLEGVKAGDRIVFNPVTATGDETKAGYLLSVSGEKATGLDHDFEMTITEIEHMILAEMNDELYQKVFPGETFENESAFLERLKQDLQKTHERETDLSFFSNVRKKLTEILNPELPEEFMKRWIKDRDEDEHDHHHDHDHDHEHDHQEKTYDFPAIFESMKWQLIEDRIIRKYEILVTEDEVMDFVKQRYMGYFAQQGVMPQSNTEEIDKTLDMLAKKYLEKQENRTDIYDMLYNQKLTGLFKDKLKLSHKTMTHDEFHKLTETHHQ